MENNNTNSLPVNDGGGLLDNYGLIDSLIIDCSELQKALVSGQYIQFCTRLVGMVQKLVNLRKGVRNDMESKQKQIDELTALLNSEVKKDVQC